jgi:hypothetical protein
MAGKLSILVISSPFRQGSQLTAIPGQALADGQTLQGLLAMEVLCQRFGVNGSGVQQEALATVEQTTLAQLIQHTTCPRLSSCPVQTAQHHVVGLDNLRRFEQSVLGGQDEPAVAGSRTVTSGQLEQRESIKFIRRGGMR